MQQLGRQQLWQCHTCCSCSEPTSCSLDFPTTFPSCGQYDTYTWYCVAKWNLSILMTIRQNKCSISQETSFQRCKSDTGVGRGALYLERCPQFGDRNARESGRVRTGILERYPQCRDFLHSSSYIYLFLIIQQSCPLQDPQPTSSIAWFNFLLLQASSTQIPPWQYLNEQLEESTLILWWEQSFHALFHYTITQL